MSGKITDNLGRSSGLVKAVEAGGGTSWQGVKTSGFTAVAGEGYPCNTTSSAFTATLPGSPSVGDTIEFIDYAQTFATNNLTIDPNGNKFQGLDDVNHLCQQNRMSVSLVYVDATKGWCPNAGANAESGNTADFILVAPPYNTEMLCIAGGGAPNGSHGAGAGGAGGYLNSFESEASGGGGASLSAIGLTPGITYTITIGGGGSSGTNNGSDSTIVGTGLTTVTALGGGYATNDGGSGGGGIGHGPNPGGSGTANQGYDGGNGAGGGYRAGGGGGGAGGAGQTAPGSGPSGNGGAGVASEITGASVTRASGGCGGAQSGGGRSAGSAQAGGGGSCSAGGSGGAGTANTGGGGGGGDHGGGTGGSGVVILRMPDANYSGTVTGSPTVATGVSGDTVVTFTGSGTIVG